MIDSQNLTRRDALAIFGSAAVLAILPGCGGNGSGGSTSSSTSLPGSALTAGYLAARTNLSHATTDVYTDNDMAGNGFVARGLLSSTGSGNDPNVPAMNEICTLDPHSGLNCIECQFLSAGSNWGGWCFMNGVLMSAQTAPSLSLIHI